MEFKKQVKHTPNQALLKAANFCAYQERSHNEVLQKLNEWGIWGDDAQIILLKLIEQNYVNEERFAIAFAGGKFRVKHWGRIKIKQELKYRGVSDYCTKKALEQIVDDDYLQTINKLAEKKWNDTKEQNIFAKRSKVAKYIISKGFEQDLVWEVLKKQHME